MCFSAGASFSASVVLGTIGLISTSRIREPQQRAFAVIPLLFAVQQVSEGMLWIGLSDAGHTQWRHFPVYIFLFFAQVIWPVWVPFSVFLLEKDRARKRILLLLVMIGLSISFYLSYCLFAYDVSAEIRLGHIHYSLEFPMAFAGISSVLYFMPTVVSLFVSSVRRMSILGACILLSFVVTKIFFDDFFISVWCFFAAILSILIVAILVSLNKLSGSRGPAPDTSDIM